MTASQPVCLTGISVAEAVVLDCSSLGDLAVAGRHSGRVSKYSDEVYYGHKRKAAGKLKPKETSTCAG